MDSIDFLIPWAAWSALTFGITYAAFRLALRHHDDYNRKRAAAEESQRLITQDEHTREQHPGEPQA